MMLNNGESERFHSTGVEDWAVADAVFPLSANQRSIWLHQALFPETPIYNVVLELRFSGDLDVEALRAAVTKLSHRHPALRTKIVLRDGRPGQVIAKDPLELAILESGPEKREGVDEIRSRLIQTRFDLQSGPIANFTLIPSEEEAVLIAVVHHIACDATSMAILERDLFTFYGEQYGGEPVRTEEDSAYRNWLGRQITGRSQMPEETAVNALKQLDPVLRLPLDRPRPVLPTFGAGRITQKLEPRLVRKLKDFATSEKATPFMLLFAAYQSLLFRLSGQDAFAIGVPFQSRPSGTEHTVGCFVSTNAIPADVRASDSLRSLLPKIRSRFFEQWAQVPWDFDDVVRSVNPERDPAVHPIFQTVMNFIVVEHAFKTLLPVNINSRLSPEPCIKFDLTLTWLSTKDGLVANWDYSTDIFARDTVERISAHFKTLLASLCDQPDAPIKTLDLLGEEQRDLLLYKWNDTKAFYPADRKIHELFEERAVHVPNAIAVAFEEKQVSYRELNEQANRLAHRLREIGVTSGALVALCLDRSPEMVVAVLAVLKAGGTYVPIEPEWPQLRIENFLSFLGSEVVISSEGFLPKIVKAQDVSSIKHIFAIDSDGLGEQPTASRSPIYDRTSWASAAKENLIFDRPAGELAYVIFTSGSTGEPKGVAAQHGPIVNLLHWMNEFTGLGPGDRTFFVGSLCFDLSVCDIFGTLAAGATIDIAPTNLVKEPILLSGYIADRPISIWNSTPATLANVLPGLRRQPKGLINDTMRYFFIGGDWVPTKMPEETRELFPRSTFVSIGGNTEAAIYSTVFPVLPRTELDATIPYGKPIQNARCYILDSELNPSPIGVQGDLYIGGVGLAKGYYNNAALSADRFVPDPYRPFPGARMYRTGDVARYKADGNIEFMGRTDHQVKIRGFRIELGEIDTAIRSLRGVVDTVVVSDRSDSGDLRVLAYVVLQGIVVAEVSEHISALLPSYMIPAAIIVLDALPISGNGKIDRKALPSPQTGAVDHRPSHIAPRTGAEAILAEIWSSLLKVKNIGVHDNFFYLGGHSLLASQLTVRIAAATGHLLMLRDVLTHPTIEGLAIRLRDLGWSGEISSKSRANIQKKVRSWGTNPI